MRRVSEPRVAVAAFAGDFFHSVMDGFVAFTEEGTVAADLVVTRPERIASRRIHKMSPVVRIRAAIGFVADGCGLKPCRGGVNGGGDVRVSQWKSHEKEHHASTLA